MNVRPNGIEPQASVPVNAARLPEDAEGMGVVVERRTEMNDEEDEQRIRQKDLHENSSVSHGRGSGLRPVNHVDSVDVQLNEQQKGDVAGAGDERVEEGTVECEPGIGDEMHHGEPIPEQKQQEDRLGNRNEDEVQRRGIRPLTRRTDDGDDHHRMAS